MYLLSTIYIFSGGLAGALLCGAILDKINQELLLSLACYITGIGIILAPFTGALIGFVVLMGVQGLGIGFLDAGKLDHNRLQLIISLH